MVPIHQGTKSSEDRVVYHPSLCWESQRKASLKEHSASNGDSRPRASSRGGTTLALRFAWALLVPPCGAVKAVWLGQARRKRHGREEPVGKLSKTQWSVRARPR